MKKIKIICVKGAPMNMAEEAVDRLMADILDPTAKDGEAATDTADQREKVIANDKTCSATTEQSDKLSTLRANVSKMCDKHNNIADQVARVIKMDDDEFDPKKAITLARTVIKGRMEAIAILGELYDMDKAGSLTDAITATDKVAKQYATMYDDLEDRYSACFGLEPMGGEDKKNDPTPDEPEMDEDPAADEDDLMDAILAARACLDRLLG